MTADRDTSPVPTIKPIDAPPDSNNPTTAMLKADIDSGRTGDKNGVLDPGLSPLGTDDEAAGTTPSPARIALARHSETVGRWGRSRSSSAAHNKHDGFPVAFVAFIAAIGILIPLGIWGFGGL
jgi:hypothetical protein